MYGFAVGKSSRYENKVHESQLQNNINSIIFHYHHRLTMTTLPTFEGDQSDE